VRANAVQPVLIGKTVETKNIARIHWLNRARMKIWIEFNPLNYPRGGSLNSGLVPNL
jgi:hypothetical protein